MILGIWGKSYLPVQNVPLGMDFSEPAHKAGFQDGDILLSADDFNIEQFNDESFRAVVEATQVKVLRQGDTAIVNIPSDFMQQLMAAKQGFASFRFPAVIKDLMPKSPGQKAGLLAGDSLVAIQGIPTVTFTDFATTIKQFKDSTVTISYYRQGLAGQALVALDSTAMVGFSAMMPFDLYETKAR